MALITLLLVAGTAPAGATSETPDESVPADETTADEADDALLTEGAAIYSANCSGCHQAGGVGLAGQFPPLIDNERMQDTDYVVATLREGREGELVVAGVTYDGRMPSFSTLSDEQVDAVVFYLQSGFQAPAAAVVGPAGPRVADGELPAFVSFITRFAMLGAVAIGVAVLGPRFVSRNDRLDTPWLDAWLKSAVIVGGFIVFTVFVPDWAMQTDTVSGLSRNTQDMVGVGLWLLGLGGGLWGLWYAHREKHI